MGRTTQKSKEKRMDPSFWWTSIGIAALLGLSAFFSGSETALTAINRATMHQLSAKGSKGARIALKLTEDNERLLGSILLGNNLVNILAASLATALFTAAFGDAGVLWATLVMTFLVLVFAEVAPKTYAITYPEKAAVRVAPVVQVAVRLFAPVVAVVRLLVRMALALAGVKADPDAAGADQGNHRAAPLRGRRRQGRARPAAGFAGPEGARGRRGDAPSARYRLDLGGCTGRGDHRVLSRLAL
jgi:Mg2+/Co2+ transporter CorB